MRRMPRTAEASACSGTRDAREEVPHHDHLAKDELEPAARRIWCTTMNITSSFASSSSRDPMPVCSASSGSTLM